MFIIIQPTVNIQYMCNISFLVVFSLSMLLLQLTITMEKGMKEKRKIERGRKEGKKEAR